MKNKENIKNGIIVGLVLVIVLGFGYFSTGMKSNNNEKSEQEAAIQKGGLAIEAEAESAAVKADEQKEHKTIGVEEYLDLKSKSKASIIYIGRPTCSYCEVASPIIKKVAKKYGLTVNYLNTDEISENDAADLVQSDKYFDGGYGTPLIVIVKDDKIIDAYEGLTTSNEYVAFFKKHGVIK